jgi:ATP-dependent DNA helicase RecG
VVLAGGAGSLEFAAFIYELESKQQRHVPLDALVILNQLAFERRIDAEKAGKLIQKGTAEGRAALEDLFERGLIEARGEKRGRVYHLAEALYERFNKATAYRRTRGIDAKDHEQIILSYVKIYGRISRSEA